MDKTKLEAIKRLKAEMKELQDKPPGSIGVTVGFADKQSRDIFHWIITMTGPKGTPYSGGLFILTADFQEDYPKSRPEVQFKTEIYHCNVGLASSANKGHVCISSINNWESQPDHLRKMNNILWDIYSLFYRQNPEDPMNGEAANLYKTNKEKFDQKVKEYVEKNAGF